MVGLEVEQTHLALSALSKFPLRVCGVSSVVSAGGAWSQISALPPELSAGIHPGRQEAKVRVAVLGSLLPT